MAWIRHQYSNPFTGEVMAIEVVPLNDLREHWDGYGGDECDCLPVRTSQRLSCGHSVPLLIHVAFDGRQLTEQDYKETSH